MHSIRPRRDAPSSPALWRGCPAGNPPSGHPATRRRHSGRVADVPPASGRRAGRAAARRTHRPGRV